MSLVSTHICISAPSCVPTHSISTLGLLSHLLPLLEIVAEIQSSKRKLSYPFAATSNTFRRVRMSYDLPWDVIINILSRLPVKSLMRFRCVCKSWHSLFTDPKFIDLHLNQTRVNNNGYVLVQHLYGNNLSLHCDETFVKNIELKPPFKTSYQSLKVDGYCNGLLCISCLNFKHFNRQHLDRDIYLWNPAIRMLKALPNFLPPSSVFGDMYLAFGFVPGIDDYRVVKFLSDGYSMEHIPYDDSFFKVPPVIEIYSLRTDSWKEIQNVVPYKIYSSSIDPILNGVVHWMAAMDVEGSCGCKFILSLDMAYEVFGEIKLPECCRDQSGEDMAATVLKESLCVFAYSTEGGNERTDIWVMKEYGAAESWSKLFTFDWFVDFLLPLGTLKNGEVVVTGDDGGLVLYDPGLQQVKGLHIPGVPRWSSVFTYYMESLVLLNEGI